VLHGVEVDILHDGTLELPGSRTGRVRHRPGVAAHDAGGQGGARLTERYLSAMRHPLVNVITHPPNRSPGAGAGYDSISTGCSGPPSRRARRWRSMALPGHLDMDGAVARQAIARGVTVVVDSDCHRAESLPVRWNSASAPPAAGWLEPRHVLNTKSVDEVRAFVARKRNPPLSRPQLPLVQAQPR
jgi:DNA polymerase (family 10)